MKGKSRNPREKALPSEFNVLNSQFRLGLLEHDIISDSPHRVMCIGSQLLYKPNFTLGISEGCSFSFFLFFF